ncbi:hypothetical protein ACVNPS_08925 [Candidatus Bipolaricaulota sp. J31]
MRKVFSGILVGGLLFLVGCVPLDAPRAGGHWIAHVSYKLWAPVVETPIAGDPTYHEAWPLEVLITTEGELTPAAWEYRGATHGGSWSSEITLELDQDRGIVVSLIARRTKYYGVEGEWERYDEVRAHGVPLIAEESAEAHLVYRLAGPTVCAAIPYLDFYSHRYPTEVEPRDGPHYEIADTGGAICGEGSYLEIILTYEEG